MIFPDLLVVPSPERSREIAMLLYAVIDASEDLEKAGEGAERIERVLEVVRGEGGEGRGGEPAERSDLYMLVLEGCVHHREMGDGRFELLESFLPLRGPHIV